ncbi:hypothetical protein, partial [Mobiluncus curtisii]|uniref:hypothetical protein n=1 Tax=Mobiluncus curtisii TaxID=2051 RepID=UPI0021E2D50F
AVAVLVSKPGRERSHHGENVFLNSNVSKKFYPRCLRADMRNWINRDFRPEHTGKFAVQDHFKGCKTKLLT